MLEMLLEEISMEVEDLLRRDCTEACGRYSMKCNDYNIVRHTWILLFDSWSTV